MLTYSQSNGQLRRDGVLIGLGYSGRGEGLSNPDKQELVNTGPLPRGSYTLWRSKATDLGPIAFSLAPYPENQMHGRSAFYIHWDNRSHNFTASEGCIVLVTTWTFYELKDGDRLEVGR